MNISFDLNGKVALVTGASSGIGRASAEMLAANGARVAINYHRNEDGAEEAQKKIAEAGGSAITIQADVTRADEVRTLIDRTVAELGPVDMLVNNAGSLIERLKILDLTEEYWDEVIDLNLKSAFLCCREVAASMMERQNRRDYQRFINCRAQWWGARFDPLLNRERRPDYVHQGVGQGACAIWRASECGVAGSY